MSDVEYIIVDPKANGPCAQPLPFRTLHCICGMKYLVCTVFPMGRCGKCGARPE